MKNKRIYLPTLLILFTLVFTAGCGNKAAEEKKKEEAAQAAGPTATVVTVAEATTQPLNYYIPVTGSIQALQTISLSPKMAARVISVAGREGESVGKGQVVVQQDTADLERQVQQAQANLQAANARLSQAETNARLQVTTNNTAIADAQQQLKSATAQLELTKRPQRSQETAVAENAVAQAQANYDKAKSDRERYETLVKEGAAAQITLDQYVNQERVSKAALDSAKKQLEISQIGGRDATIQQAQTTVERAQWALRQAKANRQQSDVRDEEIKAARATVAQSRAAVAVAQQAVADASIRSSIDGVISDRTTEPGQMAAPGSPVLTLVNLDTVYFEANVTETLLKHVRAGEAVDVTTDAYPGRVFKAKVARLYPTGSQAARVFFARIEIPNAGKMLKPGQFARGQVLAARIPNATLIPVDALIRGEEQDKARVFVVEGDVAHEKTITLGLTSEDALSIQAKNGIQPGAKVVVAGQRGIKDGDKVTLRAADDTAETKTASR